MKTPKRCPYVGMLDTQCVLPDDGHDAHATDDAGAFKTPGAWRRAYEGGRFRRPAISSQNKGTER